MTPAPPVALDARPDVPAPPGAGRGWWRRCESGPLLSAATVLFLLAVAIMLAEAFCRAFLATSFFWAGESVRHLMVRAFFLTLGAAGTAGPPHRWGSTPSISP